MREAGQWQGWLEGHVQTAPGRRKLGRGEVVLLLALQTRVSGVRAGGLCAGGKREGAGCGGWLGPQGQMTLEAPEPPCEALTAFPSREPPRKVGAGAGRI